METKVIQNGSKKHAPPPGYEMKENNEVILDGEGSPFVHCMFDGEYFPPMYEKEGKDLTLTLPIRDDDIWLSTYPKSGTHWVWEIVNMLKTQEAVVDKEAKFLITETNGDSVRAKEQDESPRLLPSHLQFHNAPVGLVSSKAKVIYVLRNPKDVAVSLYHHSIGLPLNTYAGTWNGFIKFYANATDEAMYGCQMQHAKEWLQMKDIHPDRLHVVAFENLKKDPGAEIEKIAKFLGFPLSTKLRNAIVEKTSFKKLREEKLVGAKAGLNKILYRKGEVGDWRNFFTVAQNAEMDASLQRRCEGFPLDLIYELD